MTPEAWVQLLTGSGGALAALALWVFSLWKGWMTPGPVYDAAKRRIDLLEEENSQLNEAVFKHSIRSAELASFIKTLENEMAYLKDEVQRLRRQLEEKG